MPQANCGYYNVSGGASGRSLLVEYGPSISVDIGFDPTYKHTNQGPPAPGMAGIVALIDTGATESCIDSFLAAQLNLPLVDQQETIGVHGAQQVSVYLAQIHIPILKYTLYGKFAAVPLAASGLPFKALLGRTFLRNFTMIYDGRSGAVTVVYETESHL